MQFPLFNSYSRKHFGPNLLAVCPPPVSPTAPPAGPAYLLGYLRANGCDDFDFLDLRLGVPDSHSPTWTYTGSFGESYVLELPDLPLLLELLARFDAQESLLYRPTLTLERYCRERGFSPSFLERYLNSLFRYLDWSFDQIPRIDFIGFTVWSTNLLATLLACAILKRRPNPPYIIAGGPQLTSSRASGELAVASGLIDVVALGEGEQTLFDVYRNFREGTTREEVPGTLRIDEEGRPKRTARKLMKLATVPPPSYREMNLEAYQAETGTRVVPLQFSRGCTDRCEFCSEWAFWERFRSDTVEHAVENIELMKHEYGADYILFMDSLLNGVPKRLTSLAETLVKNRTEIGWSAFMRAEMDPKTATLLARAGCHDVFVGIESFSDSTLILMNKRRTQHDNVLALEAFAGAGIAVTVGFVPGFPGDTRKKFLESIDVLRSLQGRFPRMIEIQDEPFVVQPGAPIFERLEEAGLSPVYWSDEYLEVAPRYHSISSRILCRVEGSNQGLERMGMVGVLGGVAAEAPGHGGFTFIRAHDEVLVEDTFEFQHLHNRWHLARRKNPNGHTYALIVDEPEMNELEELEAEGAVDAPASRRIRSALAGIERLHVLAPSRVGHKLIRPYSGLVASSPRRFVASPYVVARWTNESSRAQLLVAAIDSVRFWRLPTRLGNLVAVVGRRPRSARQINNLYAKEGLPGDGLERALDALVANGTFIQC